MLHSKQILQLLLSIMFNQFLYELLQELTRQHLLNAELGHAQAVVGDAVAWPVVRPDFFAQVPLPRLLFAVRSLLRQFFLHMDRVQTLLQRLYRFKNKVKYFNSSLFIGMLGALILASGHDARRYVSGSASTICFVDMLAASSTGSVSVNPDVLVIDMELLGHLRHNSDGRSTAMYASLLLSLRHSLHLVHARLMLEVLVHVLPCDLEQGVLAPLLYS